MRRKRPWPRLCLRLVLAHQFLECWILSNGIPDWIDFEHLNGNRTWSIQKPLQNRSGASGIAESSMHFSGRFRNIRAVETVLTFRKKLLRLGHRAESGVPILEERF